MFVLIVGCGRVGSAIAKRMIRQGHEVSVLDENQEAHALLEHDLDQTWEDAGGQFTVGTALEVEALTEAGIDRADVVVCSTDGDNTNIIVAQLAKKRFQVPKVVVRVLDPYRAEWYQQQGSAHRLPDPGRDRHADRGRDRRAGRRGGRLMYIIIAGAGKVGWNLARELIGEGHEVTLLESDRNRYLTVEEELEHRIQHGDASELWVLERAGIVRADMVVAVTGDDEDNMLISQVAKEKYLVEHTIARVNNPRNLEHFELLGIRPVVSATDLILRLIEHEVPHHGLVHLLDLRQEQLEIIELEVAEGAPAAGKSIGELELPEGCLVVSVLRGGTGFVPKADTVIEAGDEVLAVLNPGDEPEVCQLFGAYTAGQDGAAGTTADRRVT